MAILGRVLYAIMIILFSVLVFVWEAFASVYIVVDKSTSEIITASEKDDTALLDGQSLIILPGGFSNLDLADHITNYKYIKGKFVLNTSKIQAQLEAEEKASKKKLEEGLIDKELRRQAKESLESKGVVFTEIKEE